MLGTRTRGDEGSYLPNCQTNLVITLHVLSWHFINTTAYHLGRYEPSSPVSCRAPHLNRRLFKELACSRLLHPLHQSVYLMLRQCDQIGAFLKGLGDKFSCNNDPTILKRFGPFEKWHYFNKIWCGYFLGNFGYFLCLHLVTLCCCRGLGGWTKQLLKNLKVKDDGRYLIRFRCWEKEFNSQNDFVPPSFRSICAFSMNHLQNTCDLFLNWNFPPGFFSFIFVFLVNSV